jgi:hypothetical protein
MLFVTGGKAINLAMIKALLLLIRPVPTWEGIATAGRGLLFVLFLYLLPLLLLTSAVEGYGLHRWGKEQKGEVSYLKKFTVPETVVVEAAHSVLLLIVVFVGARAAQSFAGTFHRRHTFTNAFTVIAYGLGPLLVLRMLDLSAAITPWVPWGVGIVLTMAVLYQGLPCVMRPDPPHAIGLYFLTSMTLMVIAGLVHLVYVFYVEGRFKGLTKIVDDLIAGMPPL